MALLDRIVARAPAQQAGRAMGPGALLWAWSAYRSYCSCSFRS